MSLMNRDLLIPPHMFTDVSDKQWEITFGRVNRYAKTAADMKTETGKTYEQRLTEYLESHGKEKVKKKV